VGQFSTAIVSLGTNLPVEDVEHYPVPKVLEKPAAQEVGEEPAEQLLPAGQGVHST
jgi:hypothetical protein